MYEVTLILQCEYMLIFLIFELRLLFIVTTLASFVNYPGGPLETTTCVSFSPFVSN